MVCFSRGTKLTDRFTQEAPKLAWTLALLEVLIVTLGTLASILGAVGLVEYVPVTESARCFVLDGMAENNSGITEEHCTDHWKSQEKLKIEKSLGVVKFQVNHCSG